MNAELCVIAYLTFYKSVSDDFDKSGLTEDHFTAYSHVFSFMLRHRRKHGKWPESHTLKSRFPDLRLRKPKEPFRYYADLLKERSTYNRISRLTDMVSKILRRGEPGSAFEALKKIEDSVLSIRESVKDDYVDIDWSRSVSERFREYKKRDSEDGSYIKTPWPTLNSLIIGMTSGQLITIAARYGLGKTFLLVCMAYHAFQQDKKVLIVSNEMTVEQIQSRLDAVAAKLDWPRFQRGKLSPAQMLRYRLTMSRIKRSSGTIVVTEDTSLSGMTPGSLLAKINQHRPDIVFIDGAYLMDFGKRDVVQGMMVLSRNLKRLSRIENIPVVQVHQINRKGEQARGGGHGTIAWSDAVEQDSDIVLEIVGERRKPYRVVRILKARDHAAGDFAINFILSPRTDLSENINQLVDTGEYIGDSSNDRERTEKSS